MKARKVRFSKMCQKWRFCVFSRVFWHFLGDNLANNCLVALKTSGNLSHAYLVSFRCSERLECRRSVLAARAWCIISKIKTKSKKQFFYLFFSKTSGNLSHAYLMSFRCSERLGWVYIATGSSRECAFGACLSAKMTYFWLFLGYLACPIHAR